jgi:hypothetical protein
MFLTTRWSASNTGNEVRNMPILTKFRVGNSQRLRLLSEPSSTTIYVLEGEAMPLPNTSSSLTDSIRMELLTPSALDALSRLIPQQRNSIWWSTKSSTSVTPFWLPVMSSSGESFVLRRLSASALIENGPRESQRMTIWPNGFRLSALLLQGCVNEFR